MFQYRTRRAPWFSEVIGSATLPARFGFRTLSPVFECRAGRGRLSAHRRDDTRPPISALCDVVRVPQPLHEDRPRSADALQSPTRLGRSLRKAEAGQERNHDVEAILGPAAVLRGIREWTYELDLLKHRTGPPVRDDAVLLEHIEPEVPREIDQTNVSTTPCVVRSTDSPITTGGIRRSIDAPS